MAKGAEIIMWDSNIAKDPEKFISLELSLMEYIALLIIMPERLQMFIILSYPCSLYILDFLCNIERFLWNHFPL